MANAFLTDAFTDRVQLVAAESQNTSQQITDTIVQLHRDINDENDRRWETLLRTVVNCVALQRSCGQGVGVWLRRNHPDWTEKQRKRLTEMVTFSKGIYNEWGSIVENLTQPKMLLVNPKLFTLRKLYNSRNESWCERERRQVEKKAAGTGRTIVQQEYDQTKFEEVVQGIIRNDIMADVSHDSEQLDHFVRQLKSRLADHAASL